MTNAFILRNYILHCDLPPRWLVRELLFFFSKFVELNYPVEDEVRRGKFSTLPLQNLYFEKSK